MMQLILCKFSSFLSCSTALDDGSSEFQLVALFTCSCVTLVLFLFLFFSGMNHDLCLKSLESENSPKNFLMFHRYDFFYEQKNKNKVTIPL